MQKVLTGAQTAEKRSGACIQASCPFFACSECRTKTGWPHQSWCPRRDQTEAGCVDCLYFREKQNTCIHPIRKKVGLES